MSNALDDFYRKLEREKERRRKAYAKEFKKYPALYWALEYHRNTRGSKMSFRNLHYLLELYKVAFDNKKIVVEKAVQTGLSELFTIMSHIEAGEMGMTVFYVLPKYELRNRFVSNRIYKLHQRAPQYAELLQEAASRVRRTSLIHFGKGTLAFVGSNVEAEFVEIPVDSAYIDEKDRCNQSNLLMVPDRLTASPYKHHREISNPTTEGFGIDERFLESTQGHWHIKCPGCGEWFSPDFFKHVVKEVREDVFEPIDQDFNKEEFLGNGHDRNLDARLIHDCGHPVDRLKKGEWVHTYPNKDWLGVRIGKQYTPFTPLGDLIDKWDKSQGNERKKQLFFNSDLGLPYSSEGAKVSHGILNQCRRDYSHPVEKIERNQLRFMGVDVGGDKLHVVIRERVKGRDVNALRLVLATSVPGFSHVAQLIREYRPRIVVVDALPEIHKVMELKEQHNQVYSARFQKDVLAIKRDNKNKVLSMDRTATMDFVREAMVNELYWLPRNAEWIDHGDYYNHLSSPTRILEANEENPEKSRYIWKCARPDHYFLAEAYCGMGYQIIGDNDIFEFFSRSAGMSNDIEQFEALHGVNNPRDRKELHRLGNLNKEDFLRNVQESHAENKSRKRVDRERIRAYIDAQYKSDGKVRLEVIAQQTDELEDDVKNVLRSMGFTETRIRGEYIR